MLQFFGLSMRLSEAQIRYLPYTIVIVILKSMVKGRNHIWGATVRLNLSFWGCNPCRMAAILREGF